ncbi:putative transcription factor Nin-like family [Lupinus albus]|uniref:Putative transcription factor Nin-like family n=1 Tax=Lupinus albus TaxID=3870 RepID=A0A6A4PYG6_LUPAL|nr:putative transcription factor Nin-like family [Lupinus albus]
MDSSPTTLLTNLLVFNNTIQQELMRSVHVYEGGRKVEREFVFSENGSSYVEMKKATPILIFLNNFCVSQVSEGYQNGVWHCIFAFHSNNMPQFSHIPPLLLVTRNPKLQTIPNLHNDLDMIYNVGWKAKEKDISQGSSRDELKGNSNDLQPSQNVLPVLDQDLNCLPNEEDASDSEFQDNEMNDESLPGLAEKKKRTPSDHIAKIALSDLIKYFDMPIVEASRHLNVGLTVLKRKCREFGIHRWPHRKIKSLDNLIHDLQEEAKQQESKDKDAAMAVKERKRMLESEKENIEKKPFMDIQTETKRFRQDVFKRRHRARASEKQSSTPAAT